MKGGHHSRGYTIVEVMIVLAVSSLMFVIAASFISGKEQRTAFTEGTNEFAAQLQSVISQVATGQYSDIGLNCSSSGGVTTVGSAPANGQGTNAPCVFLGKVAYLAKGGPGPDYEVMSLAGARVANVLPGSTITPADVGPAVIDPLTTQGVVPQRLSVIDVTETTAGGPVHSFGLTFLPDLGSTDSNGNLNSGSQSVSLYYVNSLTPTSPASQAGIDTLIANTASGGNLLPAQSAVICVTDNTRYVELTLGGTTNASQLSVNVQAVPVCT